MLKKLANNVSLFAGFGRINSVLFLQFWSEVSITTQLPSILRTTPNWKQKASLYLQSRVTICRIRECQVNFRVRIKQFSTQCANKLTTINENEKKPREKDVIIGDRAAHCSGNGWENNLWLFLITTELNPHYCFHVKNVELLSLNEKSECRFLFFTSKEDNRLYVKERFPKLLTLLW